MHLIRAIRFANRKHREVGQRRKWSGKPYITHPVAVVRLLMRHTNATEAMLIAATLHDTVEDTNTTFDEIEQHFGKEVRDLVYWLTDVAKPEDGNRAARMKINRDHIEASPAEAQTIKAADSAHNLLNCVETAGAFAYKYVPEKRETYKILTKADPAMLRVLESILCDQEQQIEAKKKRKAEYESKRTDRKSN